MQSTPMAEDALKHLPRSATFGIDYDTYWNFHPCPQRSYSAELKFEL